MVIAPVAQWIERLPPEQKVARSSRAGCANLSANVPNPRSHNALRRFPALREIMVLLLLVAIASFAASKQATASWNESIVFQMNGSAKPIQLPSVGQIVTEKYNRVVAVPYIVFMPETNELLMLVGVDYPHMAATMRSTDFGATWSDPQFMITDAAGKSTLSMQVGLTYLGNGKVVTYNGVSSTDYGRTWTDTSPFPHTYQGKPFYGWDPIFTERDPKTGKVTLMIQTGYTCVGDVPSGGAAQAYMAVSTDEGRTWGEAVKVPEWDGVNEVHIARAKNRDLIAACRTTVPERFRQELDHYEGLGISISKDNGKTWSKLKKLYDWGRHHPSMVLMPNGDMVMTYVVREGYPHDADGTHNFGVEAIVSKDNGQTWDLDHKYILAAWKGNRAGPNAWWPSSQATSTVLLPDGNLLTTYGTGYRGQPNENGQPSPRDVGLVKWNLNSKGLNKDNTISSAPFDSDLRNKFDAGFALAVPGKPMRQKGWRDTIVRRLGGKQPQEQIKAELQMISEDMDMFMAVPYMIYFPEKNRLLLMFAYEYPHRAMTCYSDDLGKTWSAPKYVLKMEETSMAIGLAYLGGSKAMLQMGGNHYYSNDYGETWGDPAPTPKVSNGNAWSEWDPPLVDFDKTTGEVTRLMSFSTDNHETHIKYPEGHFLGFVRFSDDVGRTWRDEIKVPQMYAMNEVAFVRAKNGDIVAACRTDNPDRWQTEIDHYGGLAVCVSKDNGKTWSEKNWLFEWGRHHASMALMPNGDIVMTYVVRKGYIDTPDGFPQFGVEAVVSKDNGKTWDLDHRYILASWKGTIKGPDGWACSSQATSTWLLPDGSLVTAFGTGYRGQLPLSAFKPRDVGIVHWRLSGKPVDNDTRIRKAPFNSDLRNKFDPAFGPKPAPKAKAGSKNLAVKEAGAVVTSTKSDRAPSAVMHDPYLTMSALNLQTIPGWVSIKWPKEQRISQIVIHPGDPTSADYPSRDCSPINYTLQYLKNGHWNNLLPQIKDAPDFKKWAASGGTVDNFIRKHAFAPVRTNAIRIVVRKSNDSGKRVSSPDKVIIPEDKRETSIRRIEVY